MTDIPVIAVLNVDVVFVAIVSASRVIIHVQLAEAIVQILVDWKVMKTNSFNRLHSWRYLRLIKAMYLTTRKYMTLPII